MRPKFVLFLSLWCVAVSVAAGQAVPVQCTDCTSCNSPVVDCRQVLDVCAVVDDVLDCSFRKLKASFSVEESKWPMGSAMATLNLEHNLIGRVVAYPALNITTLVLRYNTIVEVDHLAFSKLTSLQDLDVSYNELAQLSAEAFQGPYSAINYEPLNIISLNLSHNQLMVLDQDLFVHLPQLTRLSLAGNPLADEHGRLARDTTVAIAGSAPNLELLDLSETGINSLPATFLKNLPVLKELVLKNNRFVLLPAHELSFAASLQILNLNNNPITAITSDRKFEVMPSVTQLHISHMPELTRIENGSLAGLTSLKYLSCSNNMRFEYISENALAAGNLTRLELHDNSLHYLPEKLVPNWKKLTLLNIQGNRWSCDCDNQWIISKLIPILKSNDALMCSQPEPMKGAFMNELASKHYEMRCLDMYDNRPDRDGNYLIATFVIVIVALVAIAGVLLYRRGRWRKGQNIDYTAIYQQHVRDTEHY